MSRPARPPVCLAAVVLAILPPGPLEGWILLPTRNLLYRLRLLRNLPHQVRKLRVSLQAQASQAEHKVLELLAAPDRPRLGCRAAAGGVNMRVVPLWLLAAGLLALSHARRVGLTFVWNRHRNNVHRPE